MNETAQDYEEIEEFIMLNKLYADAIELWKDEMEKVSNLEVTLKWALMHIDPDYIGKDGGRIEAARKLVEHVDLEFR